VDSWINNKGYSVTKHIKEGYYSDGSYYSLCKSVGFYIKPKHPSTQSPTRLAFIDAEILLSYVGPVIFLNDFCAFSTHLHASSIIVDHCRKTLAQR
jgi:hypothetical protein